MKSKFLFPLILVAGLMVVNCIVYQVNGQTPQNEPAKQQTVKYTCTMHPEVVQDKPGNCLKCGMKLVEKKDMTQGKMHQANDSCNMKHDQMKCDSIKMKKGQMMDDSAFMKHEHMKM